MIFLSFFLLSALFWLQNARAAKPPNIVLILADDMGFNDVSFHGSSQIPTPNIDRLAYEGVIFRRFYAQSRCTPSRSALMTGKYPFKFGMQEQPIKAGEPWGLPLNLKILPQYLKELGYSTHIVGKWHLGEHQSAFLPTNRGFDTFLGTPSGVVDHYDYSFFGKGYSLFNGTRPLRGLNRTYLPDLISDWAVSLIERESHSAKPFFLFVSTLAPRAAASKEHGGLQTAPEYLDRTVKAIKDPARQRYGAVMQAVDETVKKVYAALLRTDITNNTVLWFLSDNGGPSPTTATYTAVGPTSNWPLRGFKGDLFEGGVRVPAFVWSPLLPPSSTARISNNLFHIGDLFPTFLSIAGGNPVGIPNLDSVSQWDAIKNSSLPPPRTSLVLDIFNEYQHPKYAAINGSYKIVAGRYHFAPPLADGWVRPLGTSDDDPERHNGPAAVTCRVPSNRSNVPCHPSVSPCLFNIVEDPCEFNNIAAEHPDVLNGLFEYVSKENQSYVTLIQIPHADPLSEPHLNEGLWRPWLDDLGLGSNSSVAV